MAIIGNIPIFRQTHFQKLSTGKRMREWQYHLEWPQLNKHHFDDAMACNGTAWHSMAQHGTAWHSMAQHGTGWHSFSSKVSAWSTAFRDFKADTHRIAVAWQILCNLRQISITDPTATHCQVSWTHVQQAVSDVSVLKLKNLRSWQHSLITSNYI